MLDYEHPVLSLLGVVYICNTAFLIAGLVSGRVKVGVSIDTIDKNKKEDKEK